MRSDLFVETRSSSSSSTLTDTVYLESPTDQGSGNHYLVCPSVQNKKKNQLPASMNGRGQGSAFAVTDSDAEQSLAED